MRPSLSFKSLFLNRLKFSLIWIKGNYKVRFLLSFNLIPNKEIGSTKPDIWPIPKIIIPQSKQKNEVIWKEEATCNG